MNDDYIEETRQTKLAFWGFGQMMKGAAYAAVAVLGIGLTIWAVYLVGLLLPEESRQTPSPYGALEMQVLPQPTALA